MEVNTVRGTEGILYVDNQKIRLLNLTTGGWEERQLPRQDEYILQAQELLDWVEGWREGHRGEGRQARYTVEIMMAIYASARRHEVAWTPFEEKVYPLDMMVTEGALPVVMPGKYDIRGRLVRGSEDEVL